MSNAETFDATRAERFLDGLLHGRLSTVELYQEALELDPVYVHFVFRLARELAGGSSVDGRGALQRLLELNDTYPEVIKKAKEGENDPITEWFMDSYQFREYLREPIELFKMLEEKLES